MIFILFCFLHRRCDCLLSIITGFLLSDFVRIRNVSKRVLAQKFAIDKIITCSQKNSHLMLQITMVLLEIIMFIIIINNFF